MASECINLTQLPSQVGDAPPASRATSWASRAWRLWTACSVGPGAWDRFKTDRDGFARTTARCWKPTSRTAVTTPTIATLIAHQRSPRSKCRPLAFPSTRR